MTRDEAIDILKAIYFLDEKKQKALSMAIEALEDVQKHEETFEWCHDCKEYDQEKHCCHRWSKRIWETIEELRCGYER